MALSAPAGMSQSQPSPALQAALQLINEKLAGGGRTIEYEFERMRREQRGDEFAVARSYKNEPRNRYFDVLPYDDQRVTLKASSPLAALCSCRCGLSRCAQWTCCCLH